MGNHVNILGYDHRSRRLWPYLGPMLADRAIVKEFGGPLYSTPATHWFIALDGNEAVGFCAVRQTPTVWWFDYMYVRTEYRGRSVARKLADARFCHIGAWKPKPIRLTCLDSQSVGHAQRGFKVVSTRGQWVTMEHPK